MAGLNLGILLDVCEQNALGWMDPLETVRRIRPVAGSFRIPNPPRPTANVRS